MTPILRAEGLEREHRAGDVAVRALDGVDFALDEGELVAVMGPSGCGKSTLLHVLGGLDRPDAGTVELQGRRVEGLSEAQWSVLRRRSVGFVFQFFNLIADLSVADNVELPALLAGVPAREARRRREGLLDELGLPGHEHRSPAQLSGGQQQRVAIARALVNRPAVLLADEPTGNLDSHSSADVLALLRRHHERGQSILMVTHDATVAAQADRVVTMSDGRIAGG